MTTPAALFAAFPIVGQVRLMAGSRSMDTMGLPMM
jgi:hypothetical protein